LAESFLKNTPLKIFLLLLIFISVFWTFKQELKKQKDPLQIEFEKVKKGLVKNPTDPSLHLKLAEIYKKANDFKKAEKEILTARQYTSEKKTLDKNLEELKKLEQKPQEIKTEIEKLEKAVSLYPNWRDAWFKLSVLYWQIFDENKARFSLEKVLELDPNFQAAKDLKKIID